MDRRRFLRNSLLSVGGATVATQPVAAATSWTGHLPLPGLPDAVANRLADPIRLSANENALGLSPRAREAVIEGIAGANRYPFAGKEALAAKLAERHGMGRDSILLTNGSTEMIQVVVQALRTPALQVVVADPTFEDLLEFAVPQDTPVVRVPLTQDHAHDLEAMERATLSHSGPSLVYVCNPNNPTGTLTSSGAVDAWISRAPDNVFFLVDEAYFEYVVDSSYHSCDRWTNANPRVVVARTFSKVHGMAGMRLGYGIAHPDTMEWLRPWAPGTNTNHLALVAGSASLDDPGHVAHSLRANAESKAIVLDVLEEMGLSHLPSHTNFVMHEIRSDLREYRSRMESAGFLVGRPFPPLLGHNRLSLGLPEEMEAFAETLRDFRSQGWI